MEVFGWQPIKVTEPFLLMISGNENFVFNKSDTQNNPNVSSTNNAVRVYFTLFFQARD